MSDTLGADRVRRSNALDLDLIERDLRDVETDAGPPRRRHLLDRRVADVAPVPDTGAPDD